MLKCLLQNIETVFTIENKFVRLISSRNEKSNNAIENCWRIQIFELIGNKCGFDRILIEFNLFDRFENRPPVYNILTYIDLIYLTSFVTNH